MIRNGTSEKPSGVTSCPSIVGAAIGVIQPQVLLFRIPNTIRPSATAERGAAVVQLRRLLELGRTLHAPVDDEHRDHHPTSPTKTYRQLQVVVT